MSADDTLPPDGGSPDKVRSDTPGIVETSTPAAHTSTPETTNASTPRAVGRAEPDPYFAPEYTLIYACYLTALLAAIYVPVAVSVDATGNAIVKTQSTSAKNLTVAEQLKAQKELKELLGVSGGNAFQTAIGLVIPIASGVIAAAAGKRESKSKEDEE